MPERRAIFNIFFSTLRRATRTGGGVSHGVRISNIEIGTDVMRSLKCIRMRKSCALGSDPMRRECILETWERLPARRNKRLYRVSSASRIFFSPELYGKKTGFAEAYEN